MVEGGAVSEDMDEPVVVKKRAGRPPRVKTVAAPPVMQGLAPTMEQWSQIIEGLRGSKIIDEEIAATIHARAMKKALRPENETHPAVSVYNPLGERDHPREKPTHIYLIGPYPICDPGNYDTTTATEIALLNQVQPGLYPVTKSDGSEITITVKAERDAGNKPYRTTLFADGKGIMDDEQKNNWGSLLQILTEIVFKETPAASYARYQREIDDLKAKLASVAA